MTLPVPAAAPERRVSLPRLLAELRARDVDYLRGTTVDTTSAAAVAQRPLAPAALFQALAACDAPRVRDSIIGLLLLHPELAPALLAGLRAARARGAHEVAEALAVRALAALYLQRWWYPALTLALGHPPTLSERLFAQEWTTRRLPPPAEGWGGPGLRQLAARERRRGPVLAEVTDVAGDWQHQVDHVLHQQWTRRLAAGAARDGAERAERATLARALGGPGPVDHARGAGGQTPGQHSTPAPRRHSAGAKGAAPAADPTWDTAAAADGGRREEPMRCRPAVAQAEIERFLQALGQAGRQAGRVYLVGGAALVHAQVRGVGATTADIDLVLAVPDEQAVQTALRGLITQLGINVELAELAGPADVIPLPASWEASSRFVGRYGMLDVFYLDFTTLALAKMKRGTGRDLHDVELLAAQGLISRAGVEAASREIRPQLGQGRYFNVDPAPFDQQVQVVVQHLWGPPTP
jgi:hypothetical protein